jgi:hypothetical protein
VARKWTSLSDIGCRLKKRDRAKIESFFGGKTPFVKLIRLADLDPGLERKGAREAK